MWQSWSKSSLLANDIFQSCIGGAEGAGLIYNMTLYKEKAFRADLFHVLTLLLTGKYRNEVRMFKTSLFVGRRIYKHFNPLSLKRCAKFKEMISACHFMVNVFVQVQEKLVQCGFFTKLPSVAQSIVWEDLNKEILTQSSPSDDCNPVSLWKLTL